ncbi:Flp family type IVb pilin [Gilliamella sp. B2776]|uniref:Flp family type IVb pilin n=1 Tax=unclassified Gilliamella TaxID=2685620 RepID=UPI002269827B|nr:MULTISPECIES: Flp family type IVb pilin [unclassified Gilliamella]MCX8649055.1 Flp family type IVb pilin [Gilliamella sp. B2779]MCX8653069.1 Flp family type IVb pilin [Gilliamella sp. B2737]MCX8657424.1 Flp family type IVb pilin [Gilliamella sp. B2894]MCX8666010.1 Flp family type IVb pilin [Gilliamella sp. B2887]MCX8690867.1 Flp family type IVb pilin [Gilliamella sp. B2776]
MMYLSAVRAQVRNFANKFIKNERGVTAIEYAIVAAGVSSVILVIFNSSGGPVYDMLSNVFDKLSTKLSNIIS